MDGEKQRLGNEWRPMHATSRRIVSLARRLTELRWGVIRPSSSVYSLYARSQILAFRVEAECGFGRSAITMRTRPSSLSQVQPRMHQDLRQPSDKVGNPLVTITSCTPSTRLASIVVLPAESPP